MKPTRITFDPDGDILYVTFGQPTGATGYQLSDQILLRVDPQTRLAAGLTIFNYSYHASALGEIPLPGIEEQADVKSLLVNILSTTPVNQFLTIATREGKLIAKLLSPSLQQAVAG